ncbi:MAG TPA: choice-of-anchor Q domain-containing protein [Thermoflexales bacterium]|nr:choice-of-anchor Q domain-containing protein [Thermoflexales bacterium]
MHILFTTIATPALMAGSAVYVGPALGGILNMTDTIIVSHTIGISNSGTLNENYNYFNGNTTNLVTAGGATTNSGPNHPTGAQKFVNPAGDDWRLAAGNPAINTGTNMGIYTDYFGNARPFGSGFDIGYHEFALRYLYLPNTLKGTSAGW